MYEDIKINLNPYLGYSKNLVEFFLIIGYQEEILNEYGPYILDNQNNFELSIISNVISDLALNVLSPDLIIKQIYPDKPKILKADIMPKPSNIVFYSCFDSVEGGKKIVVSCYALRYYEIFTDSYQNEYYVPKAIVILSQYPYFTTFHKICSMFLDYDQSNVNRLPIELLIHCYCNYVPSPIKNNLILKDFFPNIFIPKLTGYPYADFDICKIFSIVPIKEFIKIYLMTFLELDLLIFSPDLEKLNIFMYILYLLNYPLTDSNYYWNITSIPKDDLRKGEKALNSIYMGVNCQFDWDLEINKAFAFAVDMEDKKDMINQIRKNDEAEQISKLIEYIYNILIHKKSKSFKSFFLDDMLITFKRKIKAIVKDYTTHKMNTTNSFFYINNDIIKINRRIQETFYDFVLNVLVILYKDLDVDPTLTSPVVPRNYIDVQFSEEERIFLKFLRRSIKYNTYFDQFIKDFRAIDALKVSLLFSDEYVNLKMKDIKKNIPQHIQYFNIMDNLYSLNPKTQEINFNILYSEYYKINRGKNEDNNKNTKKQLFALDQNEIKLFIYYKKNKAYFQSVKNEEIQLETIGKISIPITIKTYFFEILNRQYYLNCSLVYIFSMTFPLFSFQDSITFLKYILEGLKNVKYFQRYFCFILLRSIHRFYLANEQSGQFPNFIFNNILNYYQLIYAHLMQNFIPLNEEIFFFLKKILKEKCKDGNDINKNEKYKNTEHLVFENKEKDFEKKISDPVIKKDDKSIIFNYKGLAIKKALLNSVTLIFQKMESLHDDFSTILNFDLENMFIEEIIEVIINIISFFRTEQFKNINLANFLTEFVVLLKNVSNDLYTYKKNNEKSKSDIKEDTPDNYNKALKEKNNNSILDDNKAEENNIIINNI